MFFGEKLKFVFMNMRIQFDAIVMQKNCEIEVILVEIFEINCTCF